MEKRKRFAAGVFILCLVCSSFHTTAFAEERLKRIADDIYSYVDVKKSGPHNSFGANAGIIVGRDGILVIDTLISAKEAQRFIRDIKAISEKPIKYVVNTHHHLDHSFGNSEFVKLGAVVISQEKAKKSALEQSEQTLQNAAAYGLTAQDMEGSTIAYPTLSFGDRMEIDLGDIRAELINVNPSHTEGSILVFIPERKALFAGDILFTNFHPYMADGDLKNWVKALDYILTLNVEGIVPGHGPLSTKEDVRDMKEYILAFDKKARKLSAKSKDADYIASEIKKSLPARAEGDWIVKANIQMRYLKKQSQAK